MSLGYIGSKTKLLPFLKESIENYTSKSLSEIESFLDGFSGTGTVSNMMISNCKKVISNDIQYYSFIVCSVLTDYNLNENKLQEIIKELNEINCDNPNESDFIYYNYTPNTNCERMYLTNENGIKVDRIRKRINELIDNLTFQEYHYLIKLLLYATSKVSNTSSTYGAYLKQFKPSAKKTLTIIPVKLITSECVTECFNKDISELLNTVEYTDIFYMDSPYNSRNYSTNYFLLETIAKYDNPQIKGKTGLRVDTSTNSKFCSKVKAKTEFEIVLNKVKSKFVFISYNSESIVSKQDIIKILNVNFTNVICYEKEYKRFKSNNNGDQNKTVQEFLFSGTNKVNYK